MVVVAAAGGAGGGGSGAAHKVLLISGKQPGSSGGSPAGFGRPISVVLPSSSNQASSDSDSNSSAGPPIRKRQRLTHLSPEEKALRRLDSRTKKYLLFPRVYLRVNPVHCAGSYHPDTPKDPDPSVGQ